MGGREPEDDITLLVVRVTDRECDPAKPASSAPAESAVADA